MLPVLEHLWPEYCSMVSPQPVCGTAIAVSPKSPYGDTMITTDGRHYIDKAGAFVPFQ